MRTFVLTVLVAALGLGAAACGGSDKSSTGSSSGASSSSSSASANKGPILIGAAVDQTKLMKFFDGPALAAAQIRAAEVNAAGGVDGRKLKFQVENTRLDPGRTRAAALDLVDKGAKLMWVTCDVDWATPSTQVGISKGLLTVSPCIGTDQMGPKRFGDKGQLAYSFGNVAQDEGAALAALAKQKGFKTATVVADKSIAYTQNVCQAFANRFQQDGGKVNKTETWTEGDGTIGNVVSHVNQDKGDAIVICATTQKDLPAFVSGVRSAGNQTPILGPWSIDGSFWLPKDPKIANNIWLTTYASIYGDDPDPRVRSLIAKLTKAGQPPATGGFVTGAAAVDGIVDAVKRNNGGTDGTKLAGTFESFKNLGTVSGPISFSGQYHTVFGRSYRVIQIKNGKPRYVELIRAGTPANL
jgi:branched-chain amino acid transport system substrate-binding protein